MLGYEHGHWGHSNWLGRIGVRCIGHLPGTMPYIAETHQMELGEVVVQHGQHDAYAVLCHYAQDIPGGWVKYAPILGRVQGYEIR